MRGVGYAVEPICAVLREQGVQVAARTYRAMLAGLRIDYYNRLERGNLTGVSGSIVESLARALKLDDTERTYLSDLARAANQKRPRQRRRGPQKLSPSIQHLLDGMTGIPAFVQNGRLRCPRHERVSPRDLPPNADEPDQPQNFARFVFLDPASPEQVPDWESMARDVVAILCQEAARDPQPRPHRLIGELSTHSKDFRTMERTRQLCPVAPAVLCDMLHKWHREVSFNGRSSVS